MCKQNTCAEAVYRFPDYKPKELEPIKIKLKDCCLTCPDFDPRGLIGFGLCSLSGEREIACGHMAVCYKYLGKDDVRE